MTVDDLLRLRRDDGWQYEVVEGRLVRMPASGFRASRIARKLAARLGDYVDQHALGDVTGADGTFDLGPAGQENTGLVPDVAFIRAEHLPPHVAFDEDKAIPFAPDLAVEVASPNQYRPEMAAKARRYLDAGTRLVWVIWPRLRQVDIWRPGDIQAGATLGPDDILDGEEVVPGFVCPIADLLA